MSIKAKLARQAVRKTAKHTAHGAASKFTRRPLRSITLLALGAALGGIVGWRLGRSGGDEERSEQAAPNGPTSVVTNTNSAEHASETRAVS